MLAEKLSGSGAAAKTYIEEVFSTYLYTGNGATQTITNGVDLAGKGGLVWTKVRSTTGDNVLYDTLRGTGQLLRTNLTSVSVTDSPSLTAFNSNGFSVGSSTTSNTSGASYASWTFRRAPKFFDVVTFTAGANTNRRISHGLGTLPGMAFIKCTSAVSDWYVYHSALGSNTTLQLNTTSASVAATGIWPSPSATDIGINEPMFLTNGATYVLCLFAHDTSTDGLIQCGSFTTDASGNASVNLGWEPQFLLVKESSTTGSWRLFDTMRGWDMTTTDKYLYTNSSVAEASNDYGNPTSTGFTMGGVTSVSSTFIYLAIRRGPMKKPTSGTQVYNAIARTGTGAAATVTGVGFPPDLVIADPRNNGGVSYASFWDRLRGATNVLLPYQTAAEAAKTDAVLSLEMDGMKVGADTTNSWVNAATTYINWFFRRYPGVFDQVCYTGDDATGRSIAHNLGVAPELIIVKNRSAVVNWTVYSAATGNTSYLTLNSTSAVGTGYTGWSSTSPTNAAFYVHGSASGVNASGNNYTAHLFATLAGISKVGSYTGNGSSQTIDCGFTAGARFVLIKRTDSTGDWYVWDSTRGIVAANDPHLSLNTTAAEVTTDDSVDPVASGFAVNQLAATNINVNGASYIFLALA